MRGEMSNIMLVGRVCSLQPQAKSLISDVNCYDDKHLKCDNYLNCKTQNTTILRCTCDKHVTAYNEF
jgi:hypothetical protein